MVFESVFGVKVISILVFCLLVKYVSILEHNQWFWCKVKSGCVIINFPCIIFTVVAGRIFSLNTHTHSAYV
jgi:hypothetical protein